MMALGLALPYRVSAHGSHAAFTLIEHNALAGTLEIMHRMMALDLELALTARIGHSIRLEDEDDIERLIESYLTDYFSVSLIQGSPLPLSWVGAEISAGTVLTYQETSIGADLSRLLISNQILTKTHPTQINTVNVTIGGRTQTRMFTLGDAPQALSFS